MEENNILEILNEGINLFQDHDFVRAGIKFRNVTDMQPDNQQAWRLLGDCLYSIGKYNDAADCYKKSEQIHPGDTHCRYQLACSLMEAHHYKQATNWYRQLLDTNPQHAKALCGYGVSLLNSGAATEGLEAVRKAIALEPDNHVFHFNLGFLLHKVNKPEEAEKAFNEALRLKNDCVDALYGLGNIYSSSGQMPKAREYYRQAITIEPDYYAPYSAIGYTWQNEHISKAIEFYKHALSLNPAADDVLMRLAEAQQRIGHFENATKSYRNAINHNPENPTHYFAFSNLLSAQGLITDAIKCCQKSLELDANNHRAYSNLLMFLHYINAVSPEEIYHLHADYNEFFTPKNIQKPNFINDKDNSRKLRVGFVSADFRRHSVAYFILPLLKGLENKIVETICYSNVATPDEVTEEIHQHCGHWQNIRGLSDEKAASMIRDDRIDILVDLGGHTAEGRLQLFNHFPAPVSATWLGYPDTTGLNSIDWRIVDNVTDPANTDNADSTAKQQSAQTVPESHCTEKLLRLPGSFLCYAPPQQTPEISIPPFLENDHITFGSFNNLAKLSDETLQMWAQIINKSDGSKLCLKSRGLDDHYLQQITIKRFNKYNVSPEKLLFHGYTPNNFEHLELYGQIDIALDTFPYNGTTTTCEAIWMGIPVITLSGPTHAARVGKSLLTTLNLQEFIAKTPEEYINIAHTLSGDTDKLTALRQNLRNIMIESPLIDQDCFSDNFLTGLRKMWSEYCQQA